MKIKFISMAILLAFSFATLTGCDDEASHRKTEAYRKEQEKREKNAKENPIEYKEIEYDEDALLEAEPPMEIEPPSYYVDEAIEEIMPEGTPQEIFKIGSDMAVSNGGKNASVKISQDVYATELWTYHYNGGRGASAGTIKITAEDGTIYGPWQAKVYNTNYWIAKVNQTIPAGKYTVIDSDPATWSQNGDTGGQGMTWMVGIYK